MKLGNLFTDMSVASKADHTNQLYQIKLYKYAVAVAEYVPYHTRVAHTDRESLSFSVCLIDTALSTALLLVKLS